MIRPICNELCAPAKAVACAAFFLIACDDGSRPIDSECCDAECSSSLGSIEFESEGQSVPISGQLVITDIATDEVLLDVAVSGQSRVHASVDETSLEPYEDSTVDVRIEMEGVLYENYSQIFSLSVVQTTMCCSTCLAVEGNSVVEIGAME